MLTGSLGTERTRPVKVTAAPAPALFSRNRFVSRPGSNGSVWIRIAILAAGHRREEGHHLRASDGGCVRHDLSVDCGRDDLGLLHREISRLVAGTQPANEIGNGLDLGGW